MAENVPRVALVDLDDTLITSSEGSRRAMDAVVSTVCKAQDGDTRRRLCLAWAQARSRYWMNDDDARAGRLDPWSARRETLSIALRDCGIRAADMDELLRLYAEVKESGAHLADGAIDLLTALHEGGVWVGLITNGSSREQRAKIAQHGLAGFFQYILIEEEAGIGKPDLYLHARKLCGYPPAEAVIALGDDTTRDGRGAELTGHHFLHLASFYPCNYCSKRFNTAHVTSLRHASSYITALAPDAAAE